MRGYRRYRPHRFGGYREGRPPDVGGYREGRPPCVGGYSEGRPPDVGGYREGRPPDVGGYEKVLSFYRSLVPVIAAQFAAAPPNARQLDIAFPGDAGAGPSRPRLCFVLENAAWRIETFDVAYR